MATDIKCGSYGCVIKSFVSCGNKPKESSLLYITKIFGNEDYWKNEIELNKRIMEIDTNNDFTTKMVDYCKSSSKEMNKIKEQISNSSFYKILGYSNKYHIIYEYGGEDLDIFISGDFILGDFDILKFLRSFINIFDGIIKLNEKGLVHFDIKPDNILYDKSRNRFTLIDFGLMQEREAILTTNILKHFYRQKYVYYPSELNIFSYFVFNDLLNIDKEILNINVALYEFEKSYRYIYEQSINKSKIKKILDLLLEVIKKIKEQLEHFKNFLLLFDEIIAELKNQTTKTTVISKKYKEMCKDKSIDILTKVDVYMLGITLFNVLLKLIRKLLKVNKIDSILLIPPKLFHLISKMVILNPCDRIDIKKARDEYKKILDI